MRSPNALYRLRHHTESLIASLSTEPFSVIWINTTTDSLDTTAALTRVWSHYKFDVLFGSAGRCSTQLELSAAWKIPVITTVCSIRPHKFLCVLLSWLKQPTNPQGWNYWQYHMPTLNLNDGV